MRIFVKIVLIASILVASWFYYKNYDSSISWNVTTEAEVREVIGLEIDAPLMKHQIPLDQYLLKETFTANESKINPKINQYIFLLAWFGLCITLSGASFLKRFYFFAVMALFALFINRLNLQNISFFGLQSKVTTLIAFLSLGAPLVIFNEYKKSTPYWLRLLSMSLISGILLLGIQNNFPTEHLIAHTTYTFLIIGIFFLFAIGEEFLFAILLLITKNKSSNGNHIHFIIFSTLYVFNLILYFVDKHGIFKNNFHYYNPYVLLLLSTLIGLFTLKFKAAHLTGVFQKNVFISIILGLGIVAFSNIAMAYLRGNDAIYISYEYFILYLHLGLGLFFFFYIIFNFIDPLAKGLAIYKIAYKEQNFPYLSSKLGALAVAIGCYFYTNQSAYDLVRGGYLNYLGDIELLNGNKNLAKEYYEQGEFVAFSTHYANYQLGHFEERDRNDYEAMNYFKDANVRKPSPYAYVNYSNLAKKSTPNIALAALEHGAVNFSKNGEILNNLGILYLEKKDNKTAREKFEQAQVFENWNNAPELNLAYLNTIENKKTHEKTNLLSDNFGVNANKLPQISNKLVKINWTAFSQAPYLHKQAFLLNITSSNAYNDAVIPKIKEMINQSSNGAYNDRLRLGLAVYQYKNGSINDAFQTLDNLQANASSFEKGKFLSVLGNLALGQKAYFLANDYYNRAAFYQKRYKNGKLDALAGMGKYDEVAAELRKMVMGNPKKTEFANAVLDRLEAYILESSQEKQRNDSVTNNFSVSQIIEKGNKNAFNETFVIAAADNLKKNHVDSAYHLLLNATEINPYNTTILKKYILIALDMNLINYANQAIQKLSKLATKEELMEFYKIIEEKKKILEAEDWE